MSAFVTIVGPCSDNTVPSVMVQTEHHRYLINAGDGLQRCCNEYKVRLSKLDRILLTRLRAETLGGLCGLLLTVGDAVVNKDPSIHIYGPKNTGRFIYSLRHFFRRPNMTISVQEVELPSRVLAEDDPTLDIIPLLIFESNDDPILTKDRINSDSNDSKDNDSNINDEPQRKRAKVSHEVEETPDTINVYNVPKKFGTLLVGSTKNMDVDNESSSNNTDPVCACSYIIKAKAERGKFLPNKAIALGVKPGPDFGKLTRGIPVINDKGESIEPSQCMEMAEVPQTAIILDCPSVRFISSLVQQLESQNLIGNNTTENHGDPAVLRCVIHLTPMEVVNSQTYQQNIILALDKAGKRSNSNIDHIIANSEACTGKSVFFSSQRIQNTLGMVAPDVFQCATEKEMGTDYIKKINILRNGGLQNQSDVVCADTMMSYNLFPKQNRGLHLDKRWQSPDVSPVENPLIPKHIECLNQIIKSCSAAPFPDNIECTFLGTGAAIPSKYRNVSAILLRVEVNGTKRAILLDCGEGTYFQMCRRFGRLSANRIVRDELSLIWISHMHADHHLGLLKILVERNECDGKCSIVAPRTMLSFLREYEEIDYRITQKYNFACCSADDGMASGCLKRNPATNVNMNLVTCNRGSTQSENITIKETKKRLGLSLLSSVRVNHCFDAFGLVLEWDSGFKIVYSGDTEPCEALIQAGMNANVLIHEATLDDEKVVEAREKRHSTVSEAIKVGKGMKARKIILTHFSQRYPKIPIISSNDPSSANDENANEENESNVLVAFDLMSLTLDQIEWGHSLLPILQTLFNGESEKDEE